MADTVDEVAVMMGLTLMLERGLLNSSERGWTTETLATRQAAGMLEPARLHAAAAMLHRHRALATEHGIPVPDLPAAASTGPDAATAAPQAGPRPAGPRVEVTIGPTGELMVTGAPFEMNTVWKAQPGHRWIKSAKAWCFTPSPAVAAAIGNAIRAHGCTLAMGPKAKALAVEHTRRRDTAALLDPSAAVPDLDWAPHITRPPWEHQLRQAQFQLDSSASLIAVPMGGGKTAGTVLALNASEATRVLTVCPNKVRGVWGRELAKHSVRPWHVVDGRRTSKRARAGFVDLEVPERIRELESALFDCTCGRPHMAAVNYEVLTHDMWDGWAPRERLDWIVYDECLPPGTMIDTPSGRRAIETLTVGDAVMGVDHDTGELVETTVTATFTNPAPPTMTVVAGVEMTPNHPVWTRRGYVRADEVRADDELCVIEGGEDADAHHRVRVVRWDVRAGGAVDADPQVLRAGALGAVADVPAGVRGRGRGAPGHPGVSGRAGGADAGDAHRPGGGGEARRAPVRAGQPVPGSGGAPARAGHAALAGPFDTDWRERARADRAASAAGRGVGLAYGGSGAHGTAVALAALLLARCGLAGSDGRGGVRRALARLVGGARARRAQGRVPGRVGLDGAALPQRTRPLGVAVGARTDQVHNIETGTGNFVAGGLLTHNCHRLKSHTTHTKSRTLSVSGRAASWVRFADKRTGLSGTPISTDPAEDAFSIYRSLDPGIFGTLWTQHDAHYRIKNPRNANHVIGYRNLAELARKLSLIMYRPQVQLDLPPAVSETVEVELDASTMRAYREMETEMVTDLREFIDPTSVQAVAAERDRKAARIWARGTREALELGLTGEAARRHAGKVAREVMWAQATELDEQDPETELTAANPMVKLLRCQQLTGGVLATDDGVEARVWDTGKGGDKPSPKGEALSTVLADVGCAPERLQFSALAEGGKGGYVGVDPEPVVVMCRFSSDLAQVREIAAARGLRYGEISGNRTDGLTRDSTMSPLCDVVGVQIQAGGTGIELVRARIVVWWSVGYSLIDFDQAMKRVHRPGQTRPVLNIFLVAKGTADEAVYEALDGRRSTVSNVYRLAGFAPDEVEMLTAATDALDGENVDADDASAPDAPTLRSDARAGQVVSDLPFLDAGAGLTDAPVYKPRPSRRRKGSPTRAETPKATEYASRADEIDALQEAMFD